MEIKRDLYLNKLVSKEHNGLIKVVTGIRRCGKSYLLFQLFKNYLLESGVSKDHIIEMAFDSFENMKYRDPNVLYPYMKSLIVDDEQYYVLFDEVQLLVEFEAVLNGLMRISNVDVYVTGSNAKFLSKDIITEFRGRGDEMRMNPLSFQEFMSVYAGNKYDGWNEYILYGGLPSVLQLSSPEEKIEYLKNIFDETYINDIVGRHKVKNRAELEELLNIIASNIGSLTNPKKLADTFKSVKKVNISQKTIGNYLEYLSDSFLISSAYRYDIKGRKYIGTPMKYYYSDMGLRNARINFRQLEDTHTMENVIYNELITRGFNVDVGVVTVQKRDSDGKMTRKQLEVDFICNKGSKRYYIQSALALPTKEKMEQEQRSLKKIEDSFKKMIITKDMPAPTYSEDGILIMSIYDFLLNEDSMERM
ncbi:MAG: ATP-binding protein [Lachnospiraceae bacterium]|nr:ATP-binding protein [Lachnospiraceae bacterium]MDD3616796.1 ATP-binding protein [Lachnospiraceae bacterium]